MVDPRPLADPSSTSALRPSASGLGASAFGHPWAVRPDPVLRSAEPIPAELGWYLTRRLAASRPDGWDPEAVAPAAPLDALLANHEPLPTALGLLLLRRIAAMLDSAASVGIVVGTLAPRRVVLDGRHLVLVRDDDPTGADGAYVAPEQRHPGWSVDARASQYGLAVLAAALLGPVAAPAERVLGVARDPSPEHRFSTAGDFITALAAACGAWGMTPDAPAVALVAPIMAPPEPPTAALAALAAGPAGRAGPARRPAVAALVGAAAALGIAAGWLAGARPTGTGDRVAFDAASARSAPPVGPATASPAAGAPSAESGAIRYDVLSIGEAEGLFRRSPDHGAGTPPRVDSEAAPPVPRIDAQLAALAPGVATAPAPAAGADLGRRLAAEPADFATGARPGRPTFESGTEVTGARVIPASVQPRYPRALQEQRVPGEVDARFVVDSAGRVDASSFDVVRSSNALFTAAVRDALAALRYLPAERGGRRVAQTVEQTFRFEPPR